MIITELIQTCDACPSQWEGKTSDNRSVYIRYRHGEFSLRASLPGGSVAEAVRAEYLIDCCPETDSDGVLSTKEMLKLIATKGIIYQPNTSIEEKEPNDSSDN